MLLPFSDIQVWRTGWSQVTYVFGVLEMSTLYFWYIAIQIGNLYLLETW